MYMVYANSLTWRISYLRIVHMEYFLVSAYRNCICIFDFQLTQLGKNPGTFQFKSFLVLHEN